MQALSQLSYSPKQLEINCQTCGIHLVECGAHSMHPPKQSQHFLSNFLLTEAILAKTRKG
ncbi:hypothetical protein CWC31_18405 [Pseudoalteromonas ruthenica]|nr:hypothetical protein CWC31_18405 [Pseudoalteromonas ruthenica]